jgi:hypothetical protein
MWWFPASAGMADAHTNTDINHPKYKPQNVTLRSDAPGAT